MKRKLELMAAPLGITPIPASMTEYGHCVFAAATLSDSDVWVAAAAMRRYFPDGLTGDLHSSRLGFLLVMPYSPENTAAMRRIFPWAAPVSLREEPVVGSISPESPECTTLPFSPVLRLPAPPGEAVAVLNRWNQEQFRHGRHIRFATECRGPDPDTALACCASRFLWEIPSEQPAALPSEPAPDTGMEYAGRRFILEGAVLHFSNETALCCAASYAATLNRARRFRNQIRRLRGDDFLLSLRLPPLPPEQEALHFFYLLRELRKRGWHAPGLAPRRQLLTPELLAVARLDQCPLIWDLPEPPPQMPSDLPCQVYRS